MDLEDILVMIDADIERETDHSIGLRDKSPVMSAHREGVAEGLRRAMVYLELMRLEHKKAAMPASTAVDP